MVKFIDVDPDEINNIREAHRGRISYPILKSFMETGKTLVKLDRTGIQKSLQSLTSSISSYINRHELPIKMFTRGGQIYLMRTDLDEEGNAKSIDIDKTSFRKTITGKADPELLEDESIPEVDPTEVLERFKNEKGQYTK